MRGPNTGPHDWNAVIDGAQPLAENYAYVRTYKTMHRRSVYYVERTCVLHRNNKTKTIILLLVFGSIIRKSITSSVPLGSYIKQGRSESIFCFSVQHRQSGISHRRVNCFCDADLLLFGCLARSPTQRNPWKDNAQLIGSSQLTGLVDCPVHAHCSASLSVYVQAQQDWG